MSYQIINALQVLLTRKQFRRLWCFGVKGMTHRAIAKSEQVTHQAVTKSLGLAYKKIKKSTLFEQTRLPNDSNMDVK